MAKIKNPLFSEAALGGFGPAIVFTRWRTINVARSRVTPTNPRSTRQLVVRSILGGLSQEWGSLSEAQAAQWNDYAAAQIKSNPFGQYFATGENAYVELNFFTNDREAGSVATPPTGAFLGNISEFTAVEGAAEGEIDLAWTNPAGSDADDGIDVWITPALNNKNIAPQDSAFRHHSYVAGNLDLLDLTSLVPDAWYWIRARWLDEAGRRGLFLQAKAQAKEAA